VQGFKRCNQLALILVNKCHQLLRIYTFDNDEKKKREQHDEFLDVFVWECLRAISSSADDGDCQRVRK
jgi:hypothetical protein